jgi:hypothetical protein
VGRIGDVAGDQHGLAAGVAHEAFRGARIVVLVQVRDQHVGAFARKGEGDGAADAAVGARDDGRLASEPAMADIARLAVVGLRVQCGFAAGRRLLLSAQHDDRQAPGSCRCDEGRARGGALYEMAQCRGAGGHRRHQPDRPA